MNTLRIEKLTADCLDGRVMELDTGLPAGVHSITVTWQIDQLFPVASVEFIDDDGEPGDIDNGWLCVDMEPLTMTLERIE